jgi:hypothetical protein
MRLFLDAIVELADDIEMLFYVESGAKWWRLPHRDRDQGERTGSPGRASTSWEIRLGAKRSVWPRGRWSRVVTIGNKS